MAIKYLIHANKYGWAIRLGGWTGPNLMTCATKEEAVKTALEGRRGVDWALEPAPRDEILVCDEDAEEVKRLDRRETEMRAEATLDNRLRDALDQVAGVKP